MGVLSRGDIVRACSRAYDIEQARLAHIDRSRLEAHTGQNLVEIRLRPNHRAVGKAIEELNLPSECLIASIRRGGRTLIPRGNSRLEVSDIVVILVPEDAEAAVRARITGREGHHE